MHQLLTKAKIWFRSGMSEGGGVPIVTRFREWPFSVDFLIPTKHGKGLISEVQGGLHFRTWGGRPARNRMKKDEIKRNCLKSEGYTFLAVTDREVKKNPTLVLSQILEKMEALS